MRETPTKQFTINSLLSTSHVTYTESEMTIEKHVKLAIPIALPIIGLLLIVFLWSLQLLQIPHIVIGAIYIILGMAHPRSYYYHIDKKQNKIIYKRYGLLGTSIGKRETTANLEEIELVKIVRKTGSGFGKVDTFQTKLELRDHLELDLPSKDSLNECMEYANIYKDFLELKTPIKTTSTSF